MNDTNKETNAAYEEPKKKVYVKLIIFIALITALFIVLGAKFVLFYYRTHGIGGHYFYKGCDAEVVHQLPEGLTDEAISDAVINVEYGKEKNDFDKYECLAESHYLLGVQNVDDTHCKVYVMSLCERYRYSYTENVSGSSMCRMIDFQNEGGEWVMTDSWQPRDGAGYTASIKQTVPKEISDEAVDTQIHIKELMAENTNKAKDYFEKLNDSGSVHNAAL